MATLILGGIGAGIGSAFGNWTLGWSIGTVVGGLLFPPGGGHSERGKLDDLRVSGSNYGVGLPRVWGHMRLGGNIIWSTDLIEHRHDESVGGSGLGQSSTTYSYSVSMAMAICEGPIVGLRRIWFEKEVVWDSDNPSDSRIDSQIVFYNGSETQDVDPTIFADLTTKQGLPTTAYKGVSYVVFNDLDLFEYNNRIPNIEFEIEATSLTTLKDVLEDLCLDTGLTNTDFDFTDAEDHSINGLVRPGRMSVKETFDMLSNVYPGDIIEVDGKLKWINLGGDKLFDIPDSDLGVVYWNNGPDETSKLKYQRLFEQEIPNQLSVNYYTYHASDKDLRTYQQAEQSYVKSTKSYISNTDSFTVPLALTDSVARRMVARNLHKLWNEREEIIITLDNKYIKLSPADVVGVNVFGKLKRFKILELETPIFGPIIAKLRTDDKFAINQDHVLSATTGGTGGNNYKKIGSLTYHAWNGNALSDNHIGGTLDIPGIYLACSWPEGSPGANIFMSRDDGNSFQQIDSINSYSPIGHTTTVLGNFNNTRLFDETNTVDIILTRGVLQSVGIYDLLSGANAILIGEEIVQFMNATLVDSVTNKWRLSKLLRGQRGTNYFTASHAISERVVFLSNNIKRVQLDLSYINKEIILRFVPTGGSLATVSDFTLTITGAELKPYSPCHLSGSRDGSGNLEIDWIRRSRLNGQWSDGMDIPLGEISELYDVEIFDSSFSTLKRSFLNLTSSNVTYTSAQQITDFGSNQSTVYCRIYQKNNLIGRGYKLQGNI